MCQSKRFLWAFVIGVASVVVVSSVSAQGGRGRGGRGPGHRGGRHDARFEIDRDVFHFLLENRRQIQRTVTRRDNGVETTTESEDPEIAAKIQQHVVAMYRRLEERRPIRRRDPLFDELFRHADKIQLQVEKTDRGVRVAETSNDPYVVRLIQEHAQVVSLFLKHGFAEARRNHAVPALAVGFSSWDGRLVQYGKLHEVLAQGQHQARIRLGELTRQPHCYAVGALAGLNGEVTIVEGEIVASSVGSAGTPVSPRKPHETSATMIAAAYVPRWVETTIDRDVDPDGWEPFLRQVAAEHGLDTSKPFPFVVEGDMIALEMHVINGACPIRAARIGITLPETQQPYRKSCEEIEGKLVGFYAEESVGDVTCHGAKTHTHVVLKTQNGQSTTGHVEKVGLKAGAVLHLPR